MTRRSNMGGAIDWEKRNLEQAALLRQRNGETKEAEAEAERVAAKAAADKAEADWYAREAAERAAEREAAERAARREAAAASPAAIYPVQTIPKGFRSNRSVSAPGAGSNWVRRPAAARRTFWENRDLEQAALLRQRNGETKEAEAEAERVAAKAAADKAEADWYARDAASAAAA